MASTATTTPAPCVNLKLYVHNRCAIMMRTSLARPFRDAGGGIVLKLRPSSARSLLCRASDGGDAASAEPHSKRSMSTEGFKSSVSSEAGYVGLFVRMLGLDNDPMDREQAVTTLWKYSQGGKDCIDGIMQFPGCINLVISLLKSDSSSTCEAAAGLLRTVSSIALHIDVVSESGAIEEINGLLCKSSLTPEVKEQSLGTLWNLSTNEKVRAKIAKSELIPLLVKFLDDEDTKVKEAAGGILANLALNPSNHSILVEAGVIQKLAALLKSKDDGFRVVRKEAKTTLLELCTDEFYRTLVIEEGLVRVPLVGAAAYKAFRPVSHSWPSLPDGTELQQNSGPSRYGASELLLGLNVHENFNLEEQKVNAMIGRSQQQFLARIGAVEIDDGRKSSDLSQMQQFTLLPWIDGVARLVLIVGLEDVSAITRAAYSVAETAINEHMRIAFKEAGVVRPLIQLLQHDNEGVKEAVAYAVDRLCNSNEVCQMIEAEDGLDPLINILKSTNASQCLLEKVVTILSRFFDPGKDMKPKFHDKLINGSKEVLMDSHNSHETRGLCNTSDNVLQPDLTARQMILDSVAMVCLIKTFRISSPNLQVKVASILEYFVTSESHATAIIQAGIESVLLAVFEQASSIGVDDYDDSNLELDIVKLEEVGLAIAAASRLLSKLLGFEQFCPAINSPSFVHQLRKVLRSSIPLHAKDWVAACLVKLESHFGSSTDYKRPIDMEVTLYETIPRLVEEITNSVSDESQEAAVLELNEVVSRGLVEYSRAIATSGGIFPLVKMIDEGRALEASLTILYNLCMDSENHSAVVAAGAVPILKRIILSEGPQWTRALRVLRTLPT